MSAPEEPQIYLITPPQFEPDEFAPRLAGVLDRFPVACVRLALSSRDETQIMGAADVLRETAHARDVAIVIEAHVMMVAQLGLDGVHLTDGARSVRKARRELGRAAIVGAFCGASRHDGMTAAEAGADYVSFGPVGGERLGDGTLAGADLFAWWSEMIEVPVVAEGGIDEESIATLWSCSDFIALGEEIWSRPDPAEALGRLLSAARG